MTLPGRAPQPAAASFPARRQPWLRIAWILTAALSLWVFGGTLILTRRFADDLPARMTAGLAALEWTPDDWFLFSLATLVPLFLVFFIVGSLIFWLRSSDRMAVFAGLQMIAFGAANSFSPAREYLAVIADSPPLFFIPNALVGILSFAGLPLFFAMFPNGRIYPRWMVPLTAVFFFYVIGWNLFPDIVGDFTGPMGDLTLGLVITVFLGITVAQVIRYRRFSTSIEKQQTKWFLYGLVFIVVVLMLPSYYVLSIDPETLDPRTHLVVDLGISIGNLAFALLPISLALSILRYRLWDIDVIIRRTLQYTVLTGLLALVYFGGVVVLQGLLDPLTGAVDSLLGTVVTTLGVAALFNPLRNRIQAFLDQRFYRKKFDAERTLEHFAAFARDEVDLDRLSAALLNFAIETMQPASSSLWLENLASRRTERKK